MDDKWGEEEKEGGWDTNSNAFMNIYCEIYPFLDINIAIIKQGTKIVAYSTYSCTNKTL